jgi:F-type H+-transporting ATPase subunit b
MENLGIDPKLLIAQIVNFAVFFIIFKQFVAKPFLHFIQEEKRKEKEKERMLKEVESTHLKMQEDETSFKRRMKEERMQTLEEAKKIASTMKEEIISEAKKEAEEIVVQTKKNLEMERQQLYKDIQTQTVNLSVFIIENALKDHLTDDMKKKLTEHIVKNAGKNGVPYQN